MYNDKNIIYTGTVINPLHLIKAVRSNLVNYDFYFGSKVAQWNNVLSMYGKGKALLYQFVAAQHYQTNIFAWMDLQKWKSNMQLRY